MKRINQLIIKFLIYLFISVNFLFAQSLELKKVIQDIERGETEKANIILVSLEKDNPNSPEVKYLRALLNENGDEAAKLYKEIVFSSDVSDLKDDALFKLYQYYYARAEFSESDKYARMLKESFPESEYLNYLQKKNLSQSRLQVQQNFEQKILNDTSRNISQSEQTQPISNSNFSIQVGAFSTYSNAVRFASQFQKYPTKISEKETNGRKFFIVMVGSYATETEARNALQTLKNQYKVDGIIVSLQ
ncbi:MAG: SPOR domain-containing protein [Ignavibacteria bacterium]